MKRYISLALAAVVLVVSLAVPSYAAEFDNISYINLTDYYVFDRLIVPGNTPTIFNFDLPLDAYYYYVDIILVCNNGLSSVDIVWNNSSYPLSIVPLGNDLYRVFGTTRLALDYISLSIVTPYTANIFIKSFNISYQETVLYSAPLEAVGSCGPDNDISISLNWGDSRPISQQFTTDFNYSSWNLTLTSKDWKKYDYLDILLYAHVSNINSISAVWGGISVPFQVSMIPSTDGISPTFLLSIRVDLRGLDRSSSRELEVLLTGTALLDSYINVFSLFDCFGILEVDNVKPLAYFFSNLFSRFSTWFGNVGTWISNQTSTLTSSLSTWFGNVDTWISDQTSSLTSSLSELFSTWFNMAAYWIREQTSSLTSSLSELFSTWFNMAAYWIREQTSSLSSTISTWGQKIIDVLTPDTDAADDVVDKTQQQADQMDDNNNALQQLQRPDFNAGVSSGDISGIVSPSNTIKYTLFLSRIMQAPILSEVIMLSMIFSLAAYVLFGKR